MKNIFIFGAGVLATVLILSVAGFAYAQTSTPPQPATPSSGFGPGAMGGQGAYGSGRMGGGFRGQAVTGAYGPLHDYMESALADAFGLTPEQLQAQHDAGTTLWDYAQGQGISADKFAELMTQARTEALNKAVAGGAITQAQADFMQQRWAQRQAAGYGPGSGNCDGSGPLGMGRQGGFGGRWNQSAQP